MNRLQKKCLIATAGFHLTLLLVLVFGSAFFSEQDKPEDLKLLDVIPEKAIDAAFNSGVKSAQPPPPTPIVHPVEPQPQPQPEPPKPEIKPEAVRVVEPKPKPEPKPEKIKVADTKPVEKSEPNKIQVNLKQITRVTPKNSAQRAKDDSEKRLQQQREKAYRMAVKNLKNNFTPATTVDMPGNSSAAYANYASIVKSVYEQAWTPPDNAASDDANTKVSVTIARDGSVISSRILTPSGDSSVDATVQRTLDRITFVAAFPDDAKDKERTYIINFNLKSKRMLG
jgi:TonB family protein